MQCSKYDVSSYLYMLRVKAYSVCSIYIVGLIIEYYSIAYKLPIFLGHWFVAGEPGAAFRGPN